MLRSDAAIFTLVLMLGSFIFVTRLEATEGDPFVSIVDAQKMKSSVNVNMDLSGVVLKGIIWNKVRPVAIINDEPVAVGDEWRGLKVESIRQDSIILRDGDKTYPFFVQQDSPYSKAGPGAKKPVSGQETVQNNNAGNPYGPSGLLGPPSEESGRRPDMPY